MAATEGEFKSESTNVSIMTADLSFYTDMKLVSFSVPRVSQDQLFIEYGRELLTNFQLNGTNDSIYRINDQFGLILTPKSQNDYIRFFFHFVRGLLGAFHIVETGDDVPWATDADEGIKQEVESLLLPLTHRGLGPSGLFSNTATVIFKDTLFKTDILVASRAIEGVAIIQMMALQIFPLDRPRWSMNICLWKIYRS